MLGFLRNRHPFHRGDVIYALRDKYRHYGIYAGDDRVIHYATPSGDFGLNIVVRETSLEHFAKGDRVFTKTIPQDEVLYSVTDTLRRARSKIGKAGYNALFNNCEHFARWCKTGKAQSFQIEDALLELIENAVDGVTDVIEYIVYGIKPAWTR